MPVWRSRAGFFFLGAVAAAALVLGIRSTSPPPGATTAGMATQITILAKPAPVRHISCQHPPASIEVRAGTSLELACPPNVRVSLSFGSFVMEAISGRSLAIESMPGGHIYLAARRAGTVVVSVGGAPMTVVVRP
jgi:hypothetical protein